MYRLTVDHTIGEYKEPPNLHLAAAHPLIEYAVLQEHPLPIHDVGDGAPNKGILDVNYLLDGPLVHENLLDVFREDFNVLAHYVDVLLVRVTFISQLIK